MISFSVLEIFLSVIYAFLFGVLLAVFYELTRIMLLLPETISMIFNKMPFRDVGKLYETESSVLMKILFFLLFTIGAILLSYFALDGMVRGYALLLILIGFILMRKVAFYSLEWIIFNLLSVILYPFVKIWSKKHL